MTKIQSEICEQVLKNSSCEYVEEVVLKSPVTYGGRKRSAFSRATGHTVSVEQHPVDGHVITIRDSVNLPVRVSADQVDGDNLREEKT